jgi:CheY-like chemotaxis protein
MQLIKILVVEDVPLASIFIKNMIKILGYEADFVTSAEEALIMHYENQYDLIFNDIRLPRMDGLSMAFKIRQFERKYCLNSTRIVTITSYNLEMIKEEIQATGVNAAINKPVSPEHMLNFIKLCENSLACI